MTEKDQYVVDGFAFQNVEMAKTATVEHKRIEMLNKSIDYNNIPSVAMVYEKARDNAVFKTPLGICFMKQLYDFLLRNHYENIQDKTIPIVDGKEDLPSFEEERKQFIQREEILKNRLTAQKEKEKEQRKRYRMSVMCNLGLALLIVVLFIISMTGKTPTVLNYKSKIINQYTEWQQELEQREKVVKEKEAELNINQP